MPGKSGMDLASSDAFKPLRAVSQGTVLISPQAPGPGWTALPR